MTEDTRREEDAIKGAVVRIEKLHREIKEIVREELNVAGAYELNPAQGLVIWHLAGQALSSKMIVSGGLYIGTNPSYNIANLVRKKYLYRAPLTADKRSALLSLTQKGIRLYAFLDPRLRMRLGVVLMGYTLGE